jgi:uncharacterized protein (DUF2461 family)
MHKTEYEESVKKPMEELIETLASDFTRFAPGVQESARISLFRIHRDTRFSRSFSFIVEY